MATDTVYIHLLLFTGYCPQWPCFLSSCVCFAVFLPSPLLPFVIIFFCFKSDGCSQTLCLKTVVSWEKRLPDLQSSNHTWNIVPISKRSINKWNHSPNRVIVKQCEEMRMFSLKRRQLGLTWLFSSSIWGAFRLRRPLTPSLTHQKTEPRKGDGGEILRRQVSAPLTDICDFWVGKFLKVDIMWILWVRRNLEWKYFGLTE